jgi:hypothetical protein
MVLARSLSMRPPSEQAAGESLGHLPDAGKSLIDQ